MGRRSDHTPSELRQLALDAAREIVREDGLKGLKTRGIASRIGYTVGTLYQIFNNVDHLIEELNIETMNELHAFMEAGMRESEVNDRLRNLVSLYLTFTHDNSELWNAVLDHKPDPDHEASTAYYEGVGRLIQLVEDAISPLYHEGEEAARTQDANFLWASLYGIVTLALNGRLARAESVQSLSDVLIKTYLRSRELG